MNKYLIALIALFSATTVFAEESCTTQQGEEQVAEELEIRTDVPAHLRGAKITITTADGRTSTVPAERFKVVPRLQQFIVTKTEKSSVTSCTNTTPHRNRVSLVGGSGRQGGLDATTNGSTVEIENKVGFVGGAQYQRLLTERLSVGVQGQTNKTGSLLLGLDF